MWKEHLSEMEANKKKRGQISYLPFDTITSISKSIFAIIVQKQFISLRDYYKYVGLSIRYFIFIFFRLG